MVLAHLFDNASIFTSWRGDNSGFCTSWSYAKREYNLATAPSYDGTRTNDWSSGWRVDFEVGATLMNPLIFAGTHIGQISWTNNGD